MTPYDDPDLVRTLACLLRMRPVSMAELRAVRQLPTERLDEIVAILEAAGHVSVEGELLTVHRPEKAVAQQVATAAASAELLSTLLEEARAGTAPGEVAAEVVHGHQAQWEAWARWAQLRPPQAPLNLYPDLEVLRDVVLPDLPATLAAHADVTPRAVVPAATVVTPADRAVVEALAEAGMDIRLAPAVESWVYADAGVLCAVPLAWAEHPPTSIMIVVDPAVVAAVSAYVELVWSHALPYVAPRAEWDDILPLLGLGMSDAAIASAGRTSLRTVQRRIAGAMAHYGVTSRFELGVAWGADVSATGVSATRVSAAGRGS
jgi:hypothetical protein